MNHIDLPEPIWDAFHAVSKSNGTSEGAIAMENGYIVLIFGGVYFKILPQSFDATRLSHLPESQLEDIAEDHDWKPIFVAGKRTQHQHDPFGGDSFETPSKTLAPSCERCGDIGRITVDKGDSEDCPDCNRYYS